MPEPAAAPQPRGESPLLALIVGQIGLHSTMAGVRLAAPLQALREGHSAWSVGVLLALYAAAPVVLSLHAGRMADRLGYHRPVRLAIGLALFGASLAVASTFVVDPWSFALLCVSALFVGSAANMGLIVVQRTAGLAARTSTERVRVFSWLGIAPAFSNVIGPVSVGFLIDAGGFRAAYLFMLALPLLSWWCMRRVPMQVPAPARDAATVNTGSWDLLAAPGLKRLLCVNWLLSACWDVHAFAVPVLGFERGFNASTIGLILGSFTLSVSLVRLVIPLWAHRLREKQVLRLAMLASGSVFALYPLALSPWLMGGCALLLGLTLGSVQPMIMSTLHQLTPSGRHGEAIAFRSMVMNASSTAMPLMFGAAGTALGAAALFWMVGAAVAFGSRLVRRLPAALPP